MHVSCFRIVSIGIVAENKLLSSHQIKVTPTETLTMLDGEIKAIPTPVETTATDSAGKQQAERVISDITVTATWYPHGATNRRTPPDVRRGERVFLWQAADADKYYWSTSGMDDHLRKLETVVLTFSATPIEAADSLHPDNCYFMEVSTHKKLVTFQTSKANGEPFGYTMQFNAAEGAVTLADDVGNYFELDSAETKLTLQNADGTRLSLDRQNILGHAPKNIDLTAGSMFKVSVGGSVFTMTPGGTTLKTPSFSGEQ